jgi:hypothetical protein
LKISEIFKLHKTQPELDFIDIDPNRDIQLFLDPNFLANKSDNWSIEATQTIQSFFQILLGFLSTDKVDEARKLFRNLGEPNETCLGLSKGNPQGRGVGNTNAEDILESILRSKAVKSNLVRDLQDFVIFVDGFNKDKLSDMTTNIIKKQLIIYTQSQCNFWGIPLRKKTNSGWYWNRNKGKWDQTYEDMLVINDKIILLVPKGAVSYSVQYTPQNYHQHFVLDFLQNENLELNTALVQKRKSGQPFVTKISIIETGATAEKEFLRNFSIKNPAIFDSFKQKNRTVSKSLQHGDFGSFNIKDLCKHLIQELKQCPAGTKAADQYHKLMAGILEVIFYPNLICPFEKIHDGRKRIDISFDNAANIGFFLDLHQKFSLPCPYIFFECKNYSYDPKNPELDQLSGRFSPNRGRVGFLTCRKIENFDLFLKRCIDTYKDDRGLILPITDDDIIKLLEFVIEDKLESIDTVLRDRCRAIAIK